MKNRPFTQVTLRNERERTFSDRDVPAASVAAIRHTINAAEGMAEHALPSPFPAGYTIATTTWVDDAGIPCAGHATIMQRSRLVAFISVSLDSEPAWPLWEQHVETFTAAGTLPELIAAIEDRSMPPPPWLLVSPMDSTPDENDWLDDVSRAWSVALQTVAAEQTETALPR